MDPSANREYDFIDGLRGLAILMVVACHYFYAKEPTSFAGRLLMGFIGTGSKGVTLFFTLSGFLISWPFWKRKVNQAESVLPPGYGWRRFWKIYPPLALSVLLLTPAFILWLGRPGLFLITASQWLTGLAFLAPVSGLFNPVMWSLVVEVHFYLVLPLLFLLTKPLPAKTCLWLISLFLFAVPMLVQSLTGLGVTYYPEISDSIFTGLSFFCLGVGVAGIDNLKLWNKSWSRLGDAGWLFLLTSMIGLAWMQAIPPSAHTDLLENIFTWTFILGTACLLGYAANPQNPRARWLCAPWLRWCGIISYEWYLLHQPMIFWSRDFFGSAHGSVWKYSLIIGVPLSVSLGLAALIYQFFSLPILKYGRAKKSAGK